MIYEFTCNFFGINFKAASDGDCCKSIDFILDADPYHKKIAPHKSLILVKNFLEDYFFKKDTGNFSIIFRCKDRDILAHNGKDSNHIILDMNGYSENELKVYLELVKVNFGEKISYGDLALKSGFRNGARFIGNAMAKNRFPIIIPCHRVIRSNGEIGNFSGGANIKEYLLRHESSLLFSS